MIGAQSLKNRCNGIQCLLSPVFCKMREKKEVGEWISEKY